MLHMSFCEFAALLGISCGFAAFCGKTTRCVCMVCRMVARASVNQLEATTPFDNFSFEPIKEHQVLPCASTPFPTLRAFVLLLLFVVPLVVEQYPLLLTLQAYTLLLHCSALSPFSISRFTACSQGTALSRFRVCSQGA